MRKTVSLNLDDVPLVRLGDEKFVSGQQYFYEKSFTDSGWHRHNTGILLWVESGLLGLRTETESMVVASGTILYLLSGLHHIVHGVGIEFRGWYICLPLKTELILCRRGFVSLNLLSSFLK